MSKLLLIDDDPIFGLGFCTVLESFPDLQVVAQADTGAAALQILGSRASTEDAIDLIVLELGHGRCTHGELVGLPLCRELKAQYPTLPVFLLSSNCEPTCLAAARAVGIEGYCPKGTSLSELVKAMRQVAAGQPYWTASGNGHGAVLPTQIRKKRTPLALFSHKLRQSGLRQIDITLTSVTAQLQNPSLSTLDWFIVSGRRRELLAARWLVNQLLPPVGGSNQPVESVALGDPQGYARRATRNVPTEISRELAFSTQKSDGHGSAVPLQTQKFFDATFDQLHSGLQNLTSVPMEIDILREEKKRELLYIILQKLENVLDELRFCEVQASQLPQKRSGLLQDLWHASTTDFFGKYYTLKVGNREFEVVNVLLQDAEIVRQAILDKIPLVCELFAHLLYQTPLVIDNGSYTFGTPEARERGEAMLQNLLINITNSVVQPLLNHFADVEAIKQNFYDRNLISTREITRFRNNLSWKYRLEKYIWEPTTIFESRYSLFVLSGSGIKKISIYAPRTSDLEQLTGIQLAVTLLLEAKDAIAPRLGSAIAFLGSGVVYVLTQVIGRGIGLIGRGIIQGIGNSLQESRFGKNSERGK